MIGIICALNIEVDGLKSKMENPTEKTIAKMVYTIGTINGTKVVAVECGIGKVNAAMCAQVMIDYFNPNLIINSGIAGGLSKKLGIADLIVAKDVVQHDMDGTALGDPPGEIWFNDEKKIFINADSSIADKLIESSKKLENTKVFLGRIATGDIFVKPKESRIALSKKFSADACEMEGGAIGQVCYRNEIPFGILRCISDSVDDNEAEDFNVFKQVAADKSINIIIDFLKNI